MRQAIFDSSQDGLVSLTELQHALRLLQPGLSEARASRLAQLPLAEQTSGPKRIENGSKTVRTRHEISRLQAVFNGVSGF